MSTQALPPMSAPSAPSTAAFVVLVGTLSLLLVLAARHAYRGTRLGVKAPVLTALGLGAWLAVTGSLAQFGVLAALANTPKIGLYIVACNGLAVALALSPFGTRVIQHVPIALLVGVQGFRLPLELILHSWYEQGALPVQMTYAGDNFDIVTGVFSLITGGLLALGVFRASVERWVVLVTNLVGFGLLLMVASIAVRSTPWPLRTYLNDPPVLLAFHAPFTWIVPICVAGALLGHVLVFRWLAQSFWGSRSARSTPASRT